jgi:hypothetical protein
MRVQFCLLCRSAPRLSSDGIQGDQTMKPTVFKLNTAD